MSTRYLSIGIFLLCCTILIGQIEELKAADEFVVTGKDWVASTSDVKGAFLVGAGTIIDVEHKGPTNRKGVATRKGPDRSGIAYGSPPLAGHAV